MPLPSDVPSPGDCHPALRRIAHAIVPMLDADQPDRLHIQIPLPPKLQPLKSDPGPLTADDVLGPPTSLLTIRRAWGPAPYVGRPFVYTWRVATDELGRHIAGWRTQIRYLSSEWTDLIGDAP